MSNIVKAPIPAPLVVDKRRIQPQDQLDPVALAQMTDTGREALGHATPPAEFAVSPVMSEEAKQQIQALLVELKIRPRRGWILVKIMPSAGRIGHVLIPDVREDKPEMGIVVAVGGAHYENGGLVEPEVEIGCHVTFPKFCGLEVTVAGEKLLQLREDEIMLIAG